MDHALINQSLLEGVESNSPRPGCRASFPAHVGCKLVIFAGNTPRPRRRLNIVTDRIAHVVPMLTSFQGPATD